MTVALKNRLKNGENNIAQEFVPKSSIGTDYSFKHEIVWPNAIAFFILNILLAYGLIYIFFGKYHQSTLLWTFGFGYMTGLGVTVGAHRYYTHRTFKAKLPLQIFLLCLQTATGQNSMFVWARDHRLHHRYSDTDADPHNAKRGFFFSHVGWLMTKKHPYVIEFGRKIDMSDLVADPLVMFQKKYYYYLYVLTTFLQIGVPVYFFGESWFVAFLCYFCRYALVLNFTWLVNSAAHLYGTRPYDKNLQPVETWLVSFVTSGEGWHNYHHAFPWDYKTAELSMHFNFSATVIRWFEAIGQAYDLKTVSQEMVEKRVLRTGDGTHYKLGDDESRASVTAFGPLHPFNPTYTTTMKEPVTFVKPEGLPLFNENDSINNVKKNVLNR